MVRHSVERVVAGVVGGIWHNQREAEVDKAAEEGVYIDRGWRANNNEHSAQIERWKRKKNETTKSLEQAKKKEGKKKGEKKEK